MMLFYTRLAELLIARRALVLALIAVVTLASAASIPFLKFNFTPQQLFESTSDYNARREEFAERFGREDNLTMVILKAPDLYTPEVLTYLHRQTLSLRQVEQVKRVDSLTTLGLPRTGGEQGASLTTRPLIEQRLAERGEDASSLEAALSEEDAEALRELAGGEPLLQDQLVNGAGTMATILIWLDDEIQEAADIKRVTEALDETLEERGMPPGVTLTLGGIPRIRVEIVEDLRREQLTFIPLTGMLYFVILLVLFRRPQGALLPLGTVAVAASMTVALLVLTGSAINIINNVLPTLIFIIGISDSIHMITRQAEEVELGRTRHEAIVAMVRHTGMACLLTSATTAVGFISLIVADTDVLKAFGWQAAAGVGFAYVATLLFIPAALSYVRPVKRLDSDAGAISDLEPESLKDAPLLERGLLALARRVLARPRLTIAAGSAITALFVALSFSVVIDTKILEVYGEDHPTYLTTELLEEHFGGILPVEISVAHEQLDHFKDPEAYAKLRALQRFAVARDGILQSQSVVDFHQAARAALLHDSKQREVMPQSREEIEQIQLMIEGPPDERGGVRGFMTSDFRQARVLLRVEDFGAKKMLAEGGALKAELDALFPPELGYTTYIAGDAYVASAALDSFIRDLLYSLVMAMGIIFAMMTIVFRSLKMGLISVIPNVTPLVVTFGYMGWAGITLNTTTVIIFAISLGIAVDDTIHFLTRFNEERERREDVREALLYTYFGAGRAILLTSVLLLAGLLMLLLSDFKPTTYFGKLTGLTIAGAVFGDLFMLPPILLLAYRDRGASRGEG